MQRLAKSIYYRFKDHRRTYLVPSDFYPAYPTHAAAESAFRVFDKDGNDDISRTEIKFTLLKVYKERHFLARSMRDVGVALKTLDRILLFFAFAILFFISLSVFGVQVDQSLTSVYTIGIGASFIFKNAASNAFDAVMFLFVTQWVSLVLVLCVCLVDLCIAARLTLVIDASSITRISLSRKWVCLRWVSMNMLLV